MKKVPAIASLAFFLLLASQTNAYIPKDNLRIQRPGLFTIIRSHEERTTQRIIISPMTFEEEELERKIEETQRKADEYWRQGRVWEVVQERVHEEKMKYLDENKLREDDAKFEFELGEQVGESYSYGEYWKVSVKVKGKIGEESRKYLFRIDGLKLERISEEK